VRQSQERVCLLSALRCGIWRRYFMNWLAILGATLFFFANWQSENIHVNFSTRHGQ
jgi:hypothetical protein